MECEPWMGLAETKAVFKSSCCEFHFQHYFSILLANCDTVYGRCPAPPSQSAEAARVLWAFRNYEESATLPMISGRASERGINSTIVMRPRPQAGHLPDTSQVLSLGSTVATGSSTGFGGRGDSTLSASRQRARCFALLRLARKPKCRMRTNPLGRMCWRKRRRNSTPSSVIVFGM